jgi:metal-sulfur cluster biosynthetic enzyme
MTTVNDNEAVLLEALRQIIDPELGCNVVDLGLIYDVRREGTVAHVKMTLTSAGCPMSASLASGVETALLSVPGIEEARVEVVFDPPWSPSMMSEYGKTFLGIEE